MSYCRWSTVCENNFESDLYVYDHVDGYIAVHIAAARLAGIENAPRSAHNDAPASFIESYLARQDWRRKNESQLVRTPIDLPYAGEGRSFASARECVSFLKELRALGYNMPDHVLDESAYEMYPSE